MMMATPIAAMPTRRSRSRRTLPLVPLRDQPWRSHAACRGVDAEVFHPDNDDDAGPAKAVCAECLVRSDCLDHALDAPETYGVWGGMTASERRRVLRGEEAPASS